MFHGGVKLPFLCLTFHERDVIIFKVMRDRMKNQHIDWLNAQDSKKVVAPVEGHEGCRAVKAMSVRDLQQHDFASPTDEDCGWFGYEGLCED